jgi:PKD repeat protein
MRRVLVSLFALLILLAISGCSTDDGLVYNPNQTPTTPPPGGNPGGTAYQLICTIDLSRTVGHAPMGVNMIANIIGGTAPYYYRWDVNGDGWWDYGGWGVQEVAVHYSSAGTYEILLEVEDSAGAGYQTTAIVDVKPSGPSAQPAAYPAQAPAPLMTTLDGSGSYDLDGYVVKWEWDFEPDGVYDYESDTEPSTTYTYNTPGTYNPVLRVTDDDGLTDVASVQVIAL